MSEKKIVDYLFEAGELKRIKRSGWWLAKVKDPESVGEHTYRTAIVAFVLAKMEGSEPNRLCSAAVFHDMLETRIQDLHRVSARYIDVHEVIERQVVREQLEGLPPMMRADIEKLHNLKGPEFALLKDADYLECAFQAKEYLETGYPLAKDWLVNIEKRLKTKSAKKLFATLMKRNSGEWWKGLKKL